MNKEELKAFLTLEDVKPLKLNGVIIDEKVVRDTIISRVWRSAIVNKNKRQADKGGVKAVIASALKEGLIDKSQALDLILLGSKGEINALKEQLPKVEKSEYPSEDDIVKALKQIKENKGQA